MSRSRMWRDRVATAATTLIAVVASFLTVAVLCRWAGAELQPAIVAAILALVLARRPSPARAGHLAASFATLPSPAPSSLAPGLRSRCGCATSAEWCAKPARSSRCRSSRSW